jgi:hypothetical protein
METRPGDPKHGDFARGGQTLPRDERPGSDGRMHQLIRQHDGIRQRTLEITFLASDAEAYSFTFGYSGDGDG